MSHPLHVAALYLGVLGSASALTVVPSAILFLNGGPGEAYPSSFGQYTLRFFQDAAQTNYTDIVFDYNTTSQTITYRTGNIDEGSDWYFVSGGQLFSWDGIAGDAYVPFNGATARPYGDFYFGGTTGLGFDPDREEPNRTVLGWAHLNASSSGVTLVDSAAAYAAGSIAVGTLSATAAIPEPASTTFLCGLASVAFLAFPRRRA